MHVIKPLDLFSISVTPTWSPQPRYYDAVAVGDGVFFFSVLETWDLLWHLAVEGKFRL